MAILASILAAPVVLWRKHDCDIKWCPRLGRHQFKDPDSEIVHQLCRKHHPDYPGRKPITLAHLQQKHHLYLGKQPGKG